MPNAELRAYISECLSKGSKPEELLTTLTGAGWNVDDVNNALRELTSPSVVSPPTPPPVSERAPSPAPQVASAPPVASFETPVSSPVPQVSPVVSAEPSPLPPGIEFKPERNSAIGKMIAGVIGVAVFVVAAGSAVGYFVLFRNTTPAPEVEVALMREAMKGVTSYAFNTKLSVDLKAKMTSDTLESGRAPAPTEGMTKFVITATGTTKLGANATSTQMDMSYGMDGSVNYSAASFIIDGGIDVRVVEGKLYMRLVKVPQLLAMVGAANTLDPWKGKWISVGTSSITAINPSIDNTLSGYSATTSEEYRIKAEEIVKKDWPLIMTSPKEDPIKVSGVEVYHYQFTIDKAKLAALITDLTALSQKAYAVEDPAALKESTDFIVDAIASTSGNLYIGKKDSYLYRTDIHVPVRIATSTYGGTYQVDGSVDIMIDASQWNAIAPMVAPSDSTSIEDVYKSMYAPSMNSYVDPDTVYELPPDPDLYRPFAQCLKTKGAVMYGAFRMPESNANLALEVFGGASSSVPKVECLPLHGNVQTASCATKKIVSYPTWIFKNGTRLTGEQTLETLAAKTSCTLPDAPILQVTAAEASTNQRSFDALDTARQKSRDAHRISDIGQLQLAAELYFDANQSYPTTLSQLVPNYIPRMPLDPIDNKEYSYYVKKESGIGLSYALGASLERGDNVTLETDADQQGTTFKTADDKGCRGEANRHCYDLKP